GPVDLVEIDIIGLEAAEAGLQRLADSGAVGPPSAAQETAAAAADLAGQDPFVAVAMGGEPIADDFLGAAAGRGAARHGIEFGRIHEIDTGIARQGDLRMALGLGILAAPGHGAEADIGDLEVRATERLELHTEIPFEAARKAGRTLDQPGPAGKG